ncbi:MAG: VanW family protein [Bacteroidetes bacterium]|nr:VanW family protein [Bacteroidota bacterium]
MNQATIPQPVNRGRWRKIAGREYYILRRRWKWIVGKQHWAKQTSQQPFAHKVFAHKSVILRQLNGVHMVWQENKRTNLQIAISHLNGILIRPDETFSFWKRVGRPTMRKGYLEGLVLDNGKISSGTGGGLCQLGNLLFWIFAHSKLGITERHRHGFDVFPDSGRTVPFGAGATLSYNHVDLQAHNNTGNTFHLQLWLDDTHLHGALTSLEPECGIIRVEERNHIMQQQFWGGYSRHNQIVQITEQNGEITETLLAENHALIMYSPFLEEQRSQ